ncbi:MAG TPA: hypothetical protein VNL77_09265 [Roseiflexaceae bacterium]|nr:hypothetical protein [Roseiflexaceae bacterium]
MEGRHLEEMVSNETEHFEAVKMHLRGWSGSPPYGLMRIDRPCEVCYTHGN